MSDIKLELSEVFTGPLWQQFNIKYNEQTILAYYHTSHDLFQVICDNSDLAQEIIRRLKNLKQELTLSGQEPIMENKISPSPE
jgi:hypothetical protein